MRGRVPPSDSMPAWAAPLMALRRTVVAAIRRSRSSTRSRKRGAPGTCLVGDVTNTFATYEPLLDSELSAVLFRELLGFSAPDPGRARRRRPQRQIADLTPIEWLRPSLVPHAPYSVSPALMQAIARGEPRASRSASTSESRRRRSSSCADGTGEWRALLESLGAWNPSWTPPACGPVEYLDRLGMVDDDFIAVHGVQFTDADLSRLAARRRDGRRLPAQQPLDGRRRAADRPFLCVRRPRRGRHRQPRQRRRPEPVRRAGGDAAPGARRPGRRGSCESATLAGAAGPRLRRPISARSSPASARSSWPSGYRRMCQTWKNTWWAASSLRDLVGWLDEP